MGNKNETHIIVTRKINTDTTYLCSSGDFTVEWDHAENL